MDQRTDGRMDRPSYRDARTHLKTKGRKLARIMTFRWMQLDEEVAIKMGMIMNLKKNGKREHQLWLD